MAHQDYVSRSRPAKKKSNVYNNKPIENVGLPLKVKIIAMFSFIALIGFGYFLWTIKDLTPQEPIQLPKTTKENSPSTQLPSPPKEKWQYIEQLKSKEVEVGEYAIKDKGPYKMQCGSFRTQKQAEKMKANIAFTGLSAKVSASQGTNGTWHKVYLGPYAKKRDAEKDKHKLSGNNISTCQIWQWN